MGSVGTSKALSFEGTTFSQTNYFRMVNGRLHRNVKAGLIDEEQRPTRVAGNYNLYINSHRDVALPYSTYLIGDKTTGIVYKGEIHLDTTFSREFIKGLVDYLKKLS